MTSTNLGFTQPIPLDPATLNVWGAIVNENTELFDEAIAGVISLNVAASTDINLTQTAGASDQSRQMRFVLTGVITSDFKIYFPPAQTQRFSINNRTTGNHVITIACGTSPTPLGDTLVAAQTGNTTMVSDGTNIRREVDLIGLGIQSAIPGAIQNGAMSVATAATTATYTADYVVTATALAGLCYGLASISKTINLGTTGAGGMDTGAAPLSSYVCLYVIYNPTTLTTAMLACNIATSSGTIYSGVNLPAGYTASALVASWPTDGSGNFVVGYQRNRNFSYVSVGVLNGGAATVYTPVALTTAVPVNAVSCSGYAGVQSSNTGFGAICVASSGTATGTGLGEIQVLGFLQSNPVHYLSAPFSDLLLITPQQIAYRMTGISAITGFITISGYSI